jgi:hypothetical protein
LYVKINFSRITKNLFRKLDWTDDRTKLTMVAFSPISNFQVRLPTGKLNLIIHIRDQLDCINETNLSSVNVVSDTTQVLDLIKNLQNSSVEMTNNSIAQLLAGGDQNTFGQIIATISQDIDTINNQSFDKVVSSKS